MTRSAPDFWWDVRPGLRARLLAPLGALLGGIAARRMGRPGLRLPVPVICVGNFVVGGAGKTPMVLAVLRHLSGSGRRAAVLSRGYGGGSGRQGVTRVDPARHGAADVGDEPLLLAAAAPTYVAADRAAGAAAALADGAQILVLDDGMQNPALAKDLVLAVVDGARGIGNGLCLPAGPLRAPMAAQWPVVDRLCIIGPGAAGDAVAHAATRRGCPAFRARLVPRPASVAALRRQRLLALAGIGHPAKFFATLEAEGLDLVERRAFPDHHPFDAADRAALLARAEALGARLVTTEKDRVRLPPDFLAATLPVDLVPDEADALTAALAPLLER